MIFYLSIWFLVLQIIGFFEFPLAVTAVLIPLPMMTVWNLTFLYKLDLTQDILSLDCLVKPKLRVKR